MTDVLSMWTIYERPRDFPDRFVARRWEIRQGVPEPVPTGDMILGLTLDSLRSRLPEGLHCQPRAPGDEAHIVEVWF